MRRRGMGRAQVAVAHSILVAAYCMLKRNEPYHDLGADWHSRRNDGSPHPTPPGRPARTPRTHGDHQPSGLSQTVRSCTVEPPARRCRSMPGGRSIHGSVSKLGSSEIGGGTRAWSGIGLFLGLRVRVPVSTYSGRDQRGTSYMGDAGRHRPLDCVVLVMSDSAARGRQAPSRAWGRPAIPVSVRGAFVLVSAGGVRRPPASTRPTLRQWFARPAKTPASFPPDGRADGRTCHPS